MGLNEASKVFFSRVRLFTKLLAVSETSIKIKASSKTDHLSQKYESSNLLFRFIKCSIK